MKYNNVFKHGLETYVLIKYKASLIESLVAQMVKRLSTMWETWVRSPGSERSPEKEMATHSSTFACKILWTGGAL